MMYKSKKEISNNHFELEEKHKLNEYKNIPYVERAERITELAYKAEQVLNETRIAFNSYLKNEPRLVLKYVDDEEIGGYTGWSFDQHHDIKDDDILKPSIDCICEQAEELKRMYDKYEEHKKIEADLIWGYESFEETREAYYKMIDEYRKKGEKETE